MSKSRQVKRFPLHVSIAAIFITLIVLMGAALTWFNYAQNSAMLLLAAEQRNDQFADEVAHDFRAIYQPIISTVDVMSASAVVHAATLDQRMAMLALMERMIRQKRELSSVFVGYADGDAFIVRRADIESVAKAFEAPEGTYLVIDNIDAEEGEAPRLTRLFVDRQLSIIHRSANLDTSYDTLARPWYTLAIESDSVVVTQPYIYHFLQQPGVTVARRSSDGGAVVAADVLLQTLSESLADLPAMPETELALVLPGGHVLAYRTGLPLDVGNRGKVRLPLLSELGSSVLAGLEENFDALGRQFEFVHADQTWIGSARPLALREDSTVSLLFLTPERALIADAISMRNKGVLIAMLIVLLSLPLVWLLSNQISRPMRELADEANRIRSFDFGETVRADTYILEISQLSSAMELMKATIREFVDLINRLSAEQDFDRMLVSISHSVRTVSNADFVGVLLLDEDAQALRLVSIDTVRETAFSDIDAAEFVVQRDSGLGEYDALDRRELISQFLDRSQLPAASYQSFVLRELDIECAQWHYIPLIKRNDELVGVLFLGTLADDTGATPKKDMQQLGFVQALSGFAAVSIESRHLLKMQKALLESFIRVIASAIDAKSPYTGGHCQRVPELTKMLARAACDSDDQPYADFKLDSEGWEELHIAAWLHDCGKVTTPEYVVDKATKLETIYDRIHEIRMRFEVLKREAEIEYWKQREAGAGGEALDASLESLLQTLDDEFSFVAECNLGGEFMSDDAKTRLGEIASRTWTRTLDDRLGISWEERARLKDLASPQLPVAEPLLSDRPEHLVAREPDDRMPADNPWGFRLEVPEYKYNRGELYNLNIERGTLSDEERYKINDHIVQTIIMLEQLPFPRHLRRVPEIAGGHHEKMDGSGYPKRLVREQMTLAARMMAIADIYEALTASDRPYKKAKTISQAIRIMSFMSKDRHIDSELFALFLRSGVYLQYARKFLPESQIDEVDVDEFLDDE